MSLFKKAERRQAKLKIMITGPSGSGKTYSALRLAKAIGKKIAVIDTENNSASLYAEDFDFCVVNIAAPYTIQKYTQALQSASAEGFDVVIVDSTTHAWAGDGGLLAKKESLDARGGNSFTNWAGISKEHTQFVAALLHSPFHLITTVRSKQDYVIEQNEKGKSAPRKVGLAPIQREGLEYEFTTVFDIAMNHDAATSKDRTGMFDGFLGKLTEETGAMFLNWLGTAKPEDPEEKPPARNLPAPRGIDQPAAGANVPTAPQLKRLFAISKARHWNEAEMRSFMTDYFNIDSSSKLSLKQYDDFIKIIETETYADVMARLFPETLQPGDFGAAL